MIAAAFRYFALIFGLGFLLGTLRVMVTAPLIGETAAVLLELPVMLVASALLARQSVRLHRVTGQARAFGMGALAFLMLMAAEAMLGQLIDHQSLTQWFINLSQTPGWIGLIGQIVFALLPLFWSFTQKPAQPGTRATSARPD